MPRINKKTGTLIISMFVLVLFSVLISQWYYNDINKRIDPRIIPARELYENYNIYTQESKLDSIFILMDTIESIYASLPHYKDAYEIGVLYNNRAATWLTIGLFSHLLDSTGRDSVICLADEAVRHSIAIYTNWQTVYDSLSQEDIKMKIRGDFMQGLEAYTSEEKDKYLLSRVDEIVDSQEEIKRRLSVSYTNLGIAKRHVMEYDSAAIYYVKALELWDRNLTAENNLNALLGKAQVKRNIIQRMFPPDRL